jgi:transcriptional regulator with XRE-family HTH domain
VTSSESSPALERGFGAVVRRRRARAGLSQEALAQACHLHRTYISDLERGLKSPSLRVISAIASTFGVTAAQLVREAERA